MSPDPPSPCAILKVICARVGRVWERDYQGFTVDNHLSARMWLSTINPMATMLYYISYLIGPTSGAARFCKFKLKLQDKGNISVISW